MIFTLILAGLLTGQGPTEQSTPPLTPDARVEARVDPGLPQTLFLYGGLIHLGDGAGGVVEALWVEDGRVVAAGTEQALGSRLAGANITRIDLKGAVAVPGFQDGHGHVQQLGQELGGLDLRKAVRLQDVLDAVAARAAELSPGTWIVGHGLPDLILSEGERLDAEVLSDAAPKHPVFLRRHDRNASYANERALELAGFGEEHAIPPRVPGGEIVLNADDRATGVILDEAQYLFEPLLQEAEDGALEAQLLAAQEALLEGGWTCVHDMGVTPETLAAYERLRDKGQLKLRIVAYLEANRGLSPKILESYPTPVDAADRLAVNGVVFRLDGSLETRAAALIEDYSDATGNSGELVLSEAELTDLVHEYWQAGFQPAVRATGDLANRTALDVYQRMLQVDERFARMRPRIEHAQVISTKDIPRFPQLEVLPSMQPSQAIADRDSLEARLGEIRSGNANGWRALAPGLRQIAFGSDVSYGVPDPLVELYAARTCLGARRLAGMKRLDRRGLDGQEALAGFTSGPAYAAHQDDRRGRLSPGHWADLTILDVDPTKCEPEALLEARVLMTLINGEVVFQR